MLGGLAIGGRATDERHSRLRLIKLIIGNRGGKSHFWERPFAKESTVWQSLAVVRLMYSARRVDRPAMGRRGR
jgi:hypothetical protein